MRTISGYQRECEMGIKCIKIMVHFLLLNSRLFSLVETPLPLAFDVVSIMQLVMSCSRYPKAMHYL